MKTLARKSKDIARKYFRRKHRTNTVTKVTSLEPRLIVNRTNKHIYAQVVDRTGKVLAVASDKLLTEGTKSDRAFAVGQEIAKQTLSASCTTVVFDRNGFLYHGRVMQVAQGAREGGLQF